MSVEQEEPQEAQTEAVQTETAETNDNQEQKKGSYAPRVDLSSLPDDIRNPVEARFTHLSGLMKKQEREFLKQNNEWKSIAEQQSKQIDDLMNGVGQVASYLHNQNTEATEAQLRKESRAAFEAGDLDKYEATQDRLQDIKAQKAAQKLQPKPQNQPQKPIQRNGYDGASSASGVANEALIDGDINVEDVRLTETWQEETDESGQSLRPWAVNSSDDPELPDPDFIKANMIAARIAKRNPGIKVPQLLSEIDKQMGVRKSMPKQNVMGGSFTSPPRNNRIALTPQQEKIAIKTRFGARDGAKNDSEYIAAYRKQIEQAKKGKR